MSKASEIFYEARPVKRKICVIGSAFYPDFLDRPIRHLIVEFHSNCCNGIHSDYRAFTPIEFTEYRLANPQISALHLYLALHTHNFIAHRTIRR